MTGTGVTGPTGNGVIGPSGNGDVGSVGAGVQGVGGCGGIGVITPSSGGAGTGAIYVGIAAIGCSVLRLLR